jgi:eukaryotic-like serine/threonine-protein kinase
VLVEPIEQLNTTATVIELQVSPAQAEVRLDGHALAGPPYAIELGDTWRELTVDLTDHRGQLVRLDPATPPSSPLVITLVPSEAGTLSVLAPTVAWAEVWLDGTNIGTTPLTDKPVIEGKHRLEVRCTAAVCGEARSLSHRLVRIKPGRENKFTIE